MIDDLTSEMGIYDHLWTHALNSDETHEAIHKYCYSGGNYSEECYKFQSEAYFEKGPIDFYNIYAPLCHATSVHEFPSSASVSRVI